jgi:hypothetical protein
MTALGYRLIQSLPTVWRITGGVYNRRRGRFNYAIVGHKRPACKRFAAGPSRKRTSRPQSTIGTPRRGNHAGSKQRGPLCLALLTHELTG